MVGLLCLLGALPLIGQQFDVVQLHVEHRGFGEAASVAVKGVVRLKLASADAPDQDWRSAMVAQAGAMSGIEEVRITNDGASYRLDVHMRSRRRRMNTMVALDAHQVTVVRRGHFRPSEYSEDLVCVFMAAEDKPLTQPSEEELVERLTAPLLTRKAAATGLAGQLIQRLRTVVPSQPSISAECVSLLCALPLQQLLPLARRMELIAALSDENSDSAATAANLTSQQRANLRIALGDVSALGQTPDEAEHSITVTEGRETRVLHIGGGDDNHQIALASGWSGADEPSVRGAFAWELFKERGLHNSRPDSAVGLVLHEEVAAGRARLPGTEAERADASAVLQRLAQGADPTAAAIVFCCGAVGLVAALYAVRRLSVSLLN